MRLKGGDTWECELPGGGSERSRYDPGSYQVVVELTTNCRSDVFTPKRQSAQAVIRMVKAERFVWEIVQPVGDKTYTIHPKLRCCPRPQPLPLQVQVKSLGGDVLNASQVQKSVARPLFVGRLFVPGIAVPFDLSFRPDTTTDAFVADWPEGAARKGEYKLGVSLVEGASSAAWIPEGAGSREIRFSRRDTLLTMPWSLCALLILGAIVLVSGFLVYLAKGPLAGVVLIFTKER
jgi:hypothetical protein